FCFISKQNQMALSNLLFSTVPVSLRNYSFPSFGNAKVESFFVFAKYILKNIKTHSLNLKKPHVNRLKPGFPPLRSGAKIEQIPTPRNSSTQIKSHNPDILTNKNQRKGVRSIFMAPFS